LDGAVHLRQKDYDAARQKVLNDNGINVLRFRNDEVFREPVKVLQIILANIDNSLLAESAFSTQWRRGTVAAGDGG
jgi:very-short-patch-repair endonuclease